MLDIELHIPYTLESSDLSLDSIEASYKLFLAHEESAFTELPSSQELSSILEVSKTFRAKKNIVHIGVGGSSLGIRAIVNALSPEASIYFLESVEVSLLSLFKKINLKETMFHIASKSGNTLEVITHLDFLMSEFEKQGIKDEEFKNYFVLSSSQIEGTLNDFQKKYQIPELKIPKMLGGRFSVFSCAHLLSMEFIGLDIERFIAGAVRAQRFVSENFSLLNEVANIHTSLYEYKNIDQNILMPYDERLDNFTQWFCQLWGESLGKKKGESFVGITPIASTGSKDQHSLLQLYLHGPANKLMTFITTQKDKFPYSHTVDALQKGVESAFEEVKRPFYTIKMGELNEENLGELFQFYHYLVTLIAHKLDINPYNQPAVELAKKYTKSILNLK